MDKAALSEFGLAVLWTVLGLWLVVEVFTTYGPPTGTVTYRED